MRRKNLVWLAVSVVALLLTPPVLATSQLLEEGNLRIIGEFRTGTEVRYDLDVFDGPGAPYHIDDFYQATIHEAETHTWIDGTERDVVRVVEIQRHSRLPRSVEQPQGDETTEHWLDATTGRSLGSRTIDTEWYPQEEGWEQQTREQTRRGTSTPLHGFLTDFVLYQAPLNTTWALKFAKRLDDLENVHEAHRSAAIDGVPVLGKLRWLSHTNLPAPCSMPTLSPGAWTTGDTRRDSWVHAWYDNDSPFPLRFDCTSQRDGGEVYAATTRSHLSITGEPIVFQSAEWRLDEPHPAAQPYDVLPPETGTTLPYTLHDAHQAVTTDPGLERFQRFVAHKHLLVRAHFSVDQVTNPSPSTILPVPLPDEAEDAVARGTWVLRYVNDIGEEIRVVTSRPLQGHGEPENVAHDVAEARDDPARLFAAAEGLELIPLDAAIGQAVADGVPFDGTIRDHVSFSLGYGIANAESHVRPVYSIGSMGHDGGIQRDYDGRSGQPVAVHETVRSATPPPRPEPDAMTGNAFAERTSPGIMAGTATVAGVSALLFLLFQGKAVLGVFHAKIARSRVLDHPRREALYEFVRRNPGAPLGTAQKALELGWGSTVHHLGTLERNGFVTSRRSGRHRRFWVREDKPLGVLKREALLCEPTPRRIVELLTCDPHLSQAELARRLGLARSTVHHHVSQLAEAGLLPPPSGGTGRDPRSSRTSRPRHT